MTSGINCVFETCIPEQMGDWLQACNIKSILAEIPSSVFSCSKKKKKNDVGRISLPFFVLFFFPL